MKKIFIVCLLFILLSVPTQAQGVVIYLPLIIKSQECKMPFPTTGILDNFNRGNEGPPPSANWVNVAGSPGLVVLGNALTGSVPDGNNYGIWDTPYGPDSEAYITIATRPEDAVGSTFLGIRSDFDSLVGYEISIYRDDTGGDTVTLEYLGEGISLGSAFIDFQDGDSFGLQAIDDIIIVWYKPVGGSWTNIIEVTDDTYQAAGKIYLSFYGTTARLDDFGGGTYPSSERAYPNITIESKCRNLINNNWSFIQPVESTNYVLNPSAEVASNYTSLAGSTITRSSAYQKYGRYSYRVQTSANGQGLSLTLSTLTNSVHYVTARIRGQLPVNTRFIIGTGLKNPVYLEKIDDNWNLYGVQFNASETNGRTELRIIQQGNGIGDFYVDGIQVEPLAYWTTYIDGTQEGCAWNGVENASTSTRSGLSLAGGQVKDFYDDYGFLVEKVIGAGSPPQSVNIDDYAILPGGELNSIKVQPRDMSIVGKFIADSELELHDKQQALHLALSSENYPNNQSFKLRFNGARVQKEIKVNYKGGLEGELNAFYQDKVVSGDSSWETLYKWIEKASIQLQAPDPYWYETGESAIDLDGNDSATFRYIAGRLKSTNQWSALGPPDAGGTYLSVRSFAEDSTYLYIGGQFNNWDGNGNSDAIVRYNKSTGVYSAMGTGASGGIVYALAIMPNGDVIAGGNFASMGGVANTAHIARWDIVGNTWNPIVSGASNPVFALTVGLDGVLYAGGSFANIGGTLASNIAKYNGLSWSALGVGTSAAIVGLATHPDGSIYAVGAFNTAGGVTVNGIAKWNGSVWSALGTGTDTSDASAVAISLNGLVYIGGSFASVGGTTAANVAVWNGSSWLNLGNGTSDRVTALEVGSDGVVYVAGTVIGASNAEDNIRMWNGFAWAQLDIDLPGDPFVYAILASIYADPVLPQRYDLFLGFDTTGTGYFAGKVAVTNDGNTLAFPKIVFKRIGGTTIIVETLRNESIGKELLFNYDLLDGERLTIDLTPTKKSIVSNYFGSRLDAVLANSDFGTWSLKPGSNDITCFTADNFALYPSSLDAYLLWKDKYKSYN